MGMTATAPSKLSAGATIADVLNYQDELVRTKQYEYLGKAKLVVLEAAQDANVPSPAITRSVGVRLDWRNEELPQGGVAENFLPIAQSRDHAMLLCLGAVRRRDGKVGLPDLPDPEWRPRMPKPEEVCPPQVGIDKHGRPIYGPAWQGESPRMIPQRLEDRMSGYLKGTSLMIFQPVHQILFQPELDKNLQADYWVIKGLSADGSTLCPKTGTHLAFLVDSKTGAAYFWGGAWHISQR